MNTAITEGVKVTVQPQFRADLSNVLKNHFFFNYKIVMENFNGFDVQLIRRDWYIFDSLNDPGFVSGEGVVGEQPLLKPGQSFTYTSGCELNSEIGFMKGFYTFKNLITGDLFDVNIPMFTLIYPGRFN